MSTTETEILNKFKTQLLSFIDELIEQFGSDGQLIILRIFVANQMIIKDAMDMLISKLNQDNMLQRKMLSDRNEAFFVENNVFDSFGGTKSGYFKDLWTSDNLTNETKAVIWSWFDAFVFIADKYSKLCSTY